EGSSAKFLDEFSGALAFTWLAGDDFTQIALLNVAGGKMLSCPSIVAPQSPRHAEFFNIIGEARNADIAEKLGRELHIEAQDIACSVVVLHVRQASQSRAVGDSARHGSRIGERFRRLFL